MNRWVSILSCLLFLFFLSPVKAEKNEDLNKAFVDKYFKLSTNDADVHLKIKKKLDAKIDINGSDNKSGSEKKNTDIPLTTLSRIFQFGLLLLLGVVIYMLSRKKKTKRRF